MNLEPHDAEWPERFAAEARVIAEAIGPSITGGIHRVGSTAVPRLAAKPVTDIVVGVADLESSRPGIESSLAGGVSARPALAVRLRSHLVSVGGK